MLSFLFRHFYCIIFPYVSLNHVWTTFLTFIIGTLANTRKNILDAAECINSVGYGLSAVISNAIFRDRNDSELIMK